MKYLPINPQLFIQNRENLKKLLKPNSLVVVQSNDIMPTNADGTMAFRQNNDIFYLTGADQEESIFIFYPDALDEKLREILFLRETNEEIAIWEGAKLNKAQATEMSGLTPLMHHNRAIKSPIEVELIQTACSITEKGFRRVLNFIKPNMMEYEIEAELVHEFIRNRSKGFAYTPIIASGFNACVLHYLDNNQPCKDGDILLMDVAAEYANYASDLTRAVPVNGRFTARQKAVYNAVLRVMRAATQMLKVGNIWDEYHKAVGEVMEKELVDLGLLTIDAIRNQNPDMPAYKRYFMHGTSHFLGLDVHDVGNKYRRFEAGMVFTCEPGIYIREEGLGIRLENDILITAEGNLDLMANIPVEAEEIEDLMNQ
jgi:Xaa-Pro aminopeptidase